MQQSSWSGFAYQFVLIASFCTKIQQTKIAVKKNLALSSKQSKCMNYEGRLKVILLLQVSSHDFEPTFIIFCLNWRIIPEQPKWKQNTKPVICNKHLILLYFWFCSLPVAGARLMFLKIDLAVNKFFPQARLLLLGTYDEKSHRIVSRVVSLFY